MSDILGRVDQVLNGGLSSDALFMSWPDLAAVGGGLGLLVQRVGIQYRQEIRRIFELGPGVIPAATPANVSSNNVSAYPYDCDSPGAVSDVCAYRAQPTYYIISRPQGSLRIGKFIGPNTLTTCFYETYGNACNPNVIQFSGNAGCSATDSVTHQMTWILGGCVINEMSMNVTGQEMVFEEDIGMMVANLQLLIDGENGGCAADSNLATGGFATSVPSTLSAGISG